VDAKSFPTSTNRLIIKKILRSSKSITSILFLQINEHLRSKMVHLRSPKISSNRFLDQQNASSKSMDLESTPRRRLGSTSSMESPVVVSTSRDDDCSRGGAELKTKVQSPLLTPGKKIPRRTTNSNPRLQKKKKPACKRPCHHPTKSHHDGKNMVV
jgi:hypothetical protein